MALPVRGRVARSRPRAPRAVSLGYLTYMKKMIQRTVLPASHHHTSGIDVNITHVHVLVKYGGAHRQAALTDMVPGRIKTVLRTKV